MKDGLKATGYSEENNGSISVGCVCSNQSWGKSNFWDGPIRFRSFIWRGLWCHRIGDCSADFSYERSGLKPSIPVALEHILNLKEKLVYCLPQGNPQKTLFFVSLLVCPWGQRPIQKWRPPRLCRKKTKWRTELPESFGCPIPPSNGVDFCGEGTDHFRSFGESICKSIGTNTNINYCVELLALYLRRMII